MRLTIMCFLIFFNTVFAMIDTVAIFAVDASVLSRRDTVVYYRVPSDGRFIISISNPDTSADGMFYINVYDSATGNCIASNGFFTTGTIPLGPGDHVFYAGDPTDGLAYPRYEMSLTSQSSPTPPAPGTVLKIRLGYPTGMLAGPRFGTEHTGMDTMFLLFEDVPLSEDTVGAIFLDSLVSPPHSHRIHNYTFTAVCGIKVIARVTAWGDHGGGNCFYIDSLGCGGIYTGSPCACEYYSFIIPSGPGPHLLSITQEDDAWGDNTGTRAVMLYLVQLYPEADAGDDVTICVGDSVELGGSPAASGGTPPYSYHWTPPVGLSDPTAANPIASPDTTTEYILTVVDAADCIDEDTVVVTVNYPVIDSVWFWEETDCNDSNIVHICYTLSNCEANISVWMSADSGRTWTPAGSSWFVTLLDTVGNIGENVAPGMHCFEWVMSKDLPGVEDMDFEVRAIIEYTAGCAQLYYEDWNDGRITDDGWYIFDSSIWRYWWDSTIVPGCCDGTPAFHMSRTVTWGSWTEKEGFSHTFSPPLSGVDSVSFDFCYGYLGGSDSACFDAFVPSVSLVFTDGKEVEYHMGGFHVDGDPTSPTYGHFLPYNPDTTDSFLSINTAGMGGSYARDSCYHINRCVSEDAGWFTTAPLEEIRLAFRHGRRIVGTGLCTASVYVEFDNIRLMHSSTITADTAFYVGPLDSRPPRVELICPAETIYCHNVETFNWLVDDMFPNASVPSSLFIHYCDNIDTFITFDDSVNWPVPAMNCSDAYAVVAVPDSFCNWGYDTCKFVILCDTLGPVATIVRPFDGAYSSCEDEHIIMVIHDDDGVDPATIRLVVEGHTYSVDDPELTFRNDTLIYYPAQPFEDNQTVDVCLIEASDIHGNPLRHEVCWSFTMDFSPPWFELLEPKEFMVPDNRQDVVIAIGDNASGVDENSIEFRVVGGESYDFSELNWTYVDSIRGGVLSFIPESFGLAFPAGESVCVQVSATDTTDYCADNFSDTEFCFLIEPETFCKVHPNPFTPNGDGINDYAIFDYPKMFRLDAELSIYNLKDVLVYHRKLKRIGRISDFLSRSWNGRDNEGNKLPPGLYIWVIIQRGEVICTGTVVLAR